MPFNTVLSLLSLSIIIQLIFLAELNAECILFISSAIFSSQFLTSPAITREEFEILKNLKIIVALGKIAFDTCVKFYRENFDYNERVKFGHGSYFKLPNDVLLMGCYHPSPRNVNTGRINEKKMKHLFKKALKLY